MSTPGSTPPLVIGATGTVGGAVTEELLRRGGPVRVLVRRHQDRWAGAPVEQVVGDLADPRALSAALSGVSTAFYVSPHEVDEVALAQSFLRAAISADVRVVFAGVHISTRTVRSWLEHHLFGVAFAAYRPKLRIGRMIERSADDAVLLVPTTFFENDDLFLEEIAAGRFPMPLRGMNRVAVTDVAAAAATALLDRTLPGGTYPVCGPRTLSGPDCAAAWSSALGRPVTYTGGDRAAWAQVAEQRLPPGKKGRDFRASFGLLGWIRMQTDPHDLAATTTLLGRAPRAYEDFVAERAAQLLRGAR